MQVRTYQSGDEAAQVGIYNANGTNLAKFKPATLGEVQRRIRARDFDPKSRFYAIEGNTVIGYATFNANGRVSYPWSLPGKEACREPLFETVRSAMKAQGFDKIFAAYRKDWPRVGEFFLQHGFKHARDVVGYRVELFDLPTPADRAAIYSPLKPEDVDHLYPFAPQVLRVQSAEAWKKELFNNPYFGPECLFAARSKVDGRALAVGILITDSSYADPKQLDADMPCFRLGAFGNEGMQTKRVKGMFSFLGKLDRSLPALALDLLAQVMHQLRDTDDIDSLAAQASTDVPELVGFYDRYFRRQGSFPVFEAEI